MSDELITAIAVVGGIVVFALLFGWVNRDRDRRSLGDDPRAHSDDPEVFEKWVKETDKGQVAREREIAALATDRHQSD